MTHVSVCMGLNIVQVGMVGLWMSASWKLALLLAKREGTKNLTFWVGIFPQRVNAVQNYTDSHLGFQKHNGTFHQNYVHSTIHEPAVVWWQGSIRANNCTGSFASFKTHATPGSAKIVESKFNIKYGNMKGIGFKSPLWKPYWKHFKKRGTKWSHKYIRTKKGHLITRQYFWNWYIRRESQVNHKT